ncbi:MAG: histidine kinase [Bacteroidales bacterium]
MALKIKWNFIEGRRIKALLHLLAWAIILALPLYFFRRAQFDRHLLWVFYLNAVLSCMIFYMNYLFLVPRFYFKARRFKYLLSVVVFLTLFYFISDQSNQYVFTNIIDKGIRMENNGQPEDRLLQSSSNEGHRFTGQQQAERKTPIAPRAFRLPLEPPMRGMHLYNYAFTSLVLIFFSLGLRVMERQSEIERMHKELERQKLNSELAFLKNQISPHFFFNTLNNIYSLISINAEDSRNAVLKLSKMMRYLLYESERGDTRLSNEIDFMVNYLDLMKLRLSEKVSLKVDFPERYADFSIPPLLFIPFIENAFKHGISFREKSFIDISLSTTAESIIFNCTNSRLQAAENAENGNSGIGLENARKRLDLLFPGSHVLEINKEDSKFEVKLKIDVRS